MECFLLLSAVCDTCDIPNCMCYLLHHHTFKNLGWARVWSIPMLTAVHASGSNRVDAYRFSRENLWDVGVEPEPNAPHQTRRTTTQRFVERRLWICYQQQNQNLDEDNYFKILQMIMQSPANGLTASTVMTLFDVCTSTGFPVFVGDHAAVVYFIWIKLQAWLQSGIVSRAVLALQR